MRRLYPASVLLALLAGCVLFATGCFEHRTPLAPIGSRIVLRLHENLAATGRSLELLGKTEKIYGCLNFSIFYDLRLAGDAISVRFDGISMPDICATALGPARCSVPLGPTVTGARRLVLATRDGSAVTRLVVDADSIEVQGAPGAGIVIPARVLHRVPPGTIWGWIGWGPSDQSARAQAYIDSLALVGAQPARLLPGDYEYFQVDAQGRVTLPGLLGFYFMRPYAAHYDGDPARLPGVVKAFGDSLWISLYDDRGGTLYSWMLRGSAAPALARR
jgi:hypothetical protein